MTQTIDINTFLQTTIYVFTHFIKGLIVRREEDERESGRRDVLNETFHIYRITANCRMPTAKLMTGV